MTAEHAAIGRPAMFKLHFHYGDCNVELASDRAEIKNEETVLVREVRPGEITLTKERMQQIWEQQSDREWETPGEAFGRFLAELFSEGTQGGGK